jgi:tetratricopeptide (TPR) repeat protein
MTQGSLPASAPRRSAETDVLLAEGRSRLEANDLAGAVDAFSRGLALVPSDPDLLFFRAIAKHRQKDYAGGVADNEAVLQARPNYDDARYNLGLCRAGMGQYEAAEAEFGRFLEHHPDDAEAMIRRGIARLACNRPRAALADLDRSVELKPEQAENRFHRARAYQALARWSDAVAEYDRVLTLDATYLNANFNRAWCRGKLTDHIGAIEDYTRYLEKFPEDVDGYIYRGNRRLDQADFRWAAEDYEKAVQMAPKMEADLRPWIERALRLRTLELEGPPAEMAKACCERGWGKVDSDEPANGLLWFERALKADERSSDAWHGTGVAFYLQNRHPEALKHLRKAEQLAPKNPEILCDLARTERATGEKTRAVERLTKAIELKQDLSRAYWWRGLLHLESEQFKRSVEDFSKYLEFDPAKNAAAWNYRGKARQRLGRAAEAAMDFTRAIELSPGEAEYYANRGHSRLELKDRKGASEDFEKASALNPELKPSLNAALAARSAPGKGVAAGSGHAAASGRPSPPLDPAGVKVSLVGWSVFAAVMVGLGLSGIPILGDLPRRVLDAGYKGWWVVDHWNDAVAFPPKSELCMFPFCTKTDTHKKFVGGHRGYTSQVLHYYCGAHEPTFFSMGIRFDGFLYMLYWFAAIVLSVFLYGPPVALLLRVAMWPVLIPMWRAGKISSGFLFPRLQDFTSAGETKLISFTVSAALGFTLALWIMYAWW